MKKLIAVITIAALFIGSFAMAVTAETTADSKLSPALQEALQSMADNEKCTVEMKTYNPGQYRLHDQDAAIIEKLNIKMVDLLSWDTSNDLMYLEMTKAQITAAILMDEVKYIREYTFTPVESTAPTNPAVDPSDKIPPVLAGKLSALTDDDKLTVEIYANTAETSRYYSYHQKIIDALDIKDDAIIERQRYWYSFVAVLTKRQIEAAMQMYEVRYITIPFDAPAVDPTEAETKDDSLLYEDAVKKQYLDFYSYKELYYHTDENGDIDWVLITGKQPEAVRKPLYQIIGNRLVIKKEQISPFGAGCGLYDVKQDKVRPVFAYLLPEYDGLEEAYDRFGEGRLLGDLDKDNELTILDATLIQRCLVGLSDYPDDDTVVVYEEQEDALSYYSDFDRDGERTIIDATAIQRHLAGLKKK